MDEINELAKKANGEIEFELDKYPARKNIRDFAERIENFSKKYPKVNYNKIRRSILIQDIILQRTNSASDKIKNRLTIQSVFYRQLLLEVTVARQGLQSEKEATEQVQLCEKVNSISREADILRAYQLIIS